MLNTLVHTSAYIYETRTNVFLDDMKLNEKKNTGRRGGEHVMRCQSVISVTNDENCVRSVLEVTPKPDYKVSEVNNQK